MLSPARADFSKRDGVLGQPVNRGGDGPGRISDDALLPGAPHLGDSVRQGSAGVFDGDDLRWHPRGIEFESRSAQRVTPSDAQGRQRVAAQSTGVSWTLHGNELEVVRGDRAISIVSLDQERSFETGLFEAVDLRNFKQVCALGRQIGTREQLAGSV